MRLERWAAFAPLAIILYFIVQLALRLWLSPNLEVDDAEMVGQIDWAWGYPDSHPPLYHWLVRLCHELFGNWVASYDEMARDVATVTAAPFAVLGDRPENAVNIVLRLPSATMFDARRPVERVVIAADTPAAAAELRARALEPHTRRKPNRASSATASPPSVVGRRS